MEKIKRAVHFDFHTMPNIHDFGEQWDAGLFAHTLKKANVKFINATAQCNIGFAYFPTKTGVPYPEMKGDLFGSLVKECHKEDIRVIGYVSTGLNHEAARRHPEWCRVDDEGRIIYGDRTGNFFRTQCYNTGYAEHILSILKEVVEYGVDGLFCDNVITYKCYCTKCTEQMKKEGIDIENPQQVYDFAYKSTKRFAEKIRDIVPKDKFLRLNGYGGDKPELNSHAEIECLPSGGWGYDNFASTVSYMRNFYDQCVYMTGRFQRSWGDFGGFRTKASLENDFYDAIMNNAQISVGDHLHPRGRLVPPLYDMIGDIYRQLEKYEKWTDNTKYLKEVGAIRNITDSTTPYENRYPYDGLARMMGELKYNFDTINENMDLEPYDVLILPDVVKMTDKLKNKISEYLKNDNKAVLSSGTSILNSDNTGICCPQWDFAEFCGMDDTSTAYYKLNGNDLTYAMYRGGILMKAKKREQQLAAYVEPYFDKHWDGMHGYFYTPPMSETGHAAIAEHDRVRHISFKVFDAYYASAAKFHRDLVEDFLKKFIKKPLICAPGLPSTSRVTVTGTDKYRLLHVKVTYPEVRGLTDIIEEHNILKEGYTVSVRGEFKNVVLLPDETDVEFTVSDGYTNIKLPEITGFAMFKLS